MDWLMCAAGVAGVYHRVKDIAYQDAYAVGNDGETLVGFLTDGCGSGKHSDVGAKLGADFLLRRTLEKLGQTKSLVGLSEGLFKDLTGYLNLLMINQGIKGTSERLSFVDDYLRFTVMGMIVRPKEAMVLSCGDGVIVFNEEMIYLDQNNSPTYPSYVLVKDQIPSELVPEGFTNWEIEIDKLFQLAVSSDAFADEEKRLLEAMRVKSSNQLQMKLNVWTQIDEVISDDATVITIRRR